MRSPWLGLLGSLALAFGGAWLLWQSSRPPEIRITWTTGSEQEVAAFRIWRGPAGAEATPGYAVGPEAIPAEGSALSGADYALLDREVEPGQTYVYQIEEIGLDGESSRLPDRIEARAPDRALLLGLEGLGLVLLGLWLARRHGLELAGNPSAAKVAGRDGPDEAGLAGSRDEF